MKREYVKRSWAQKLAQVREACRRIAERGETITDVCRDPRMPQRSTFMAWLEAEPDLRGLVDAAQAEAATRFTPRRRYHRWDEAVAAEVLARIEDGRGLREVCAERDMPVHSTVTRWLRERPAFAQAYRRAREAQADRLFDLAWTIALECDGSPREVAAARLRIQTLKWRVGRLAPRVYGPQKAVEPGPDGGGGRAQGRVVAIEIREFAPTPDGRVLDITSACRGRSKAECTALYMAISEGRVSPEEVAALNVAADLALDQRADPQMAGAADGGGN